MARRRYYQGQKSGNKASSTQESDVVKQLEEAAREIDRRAKYDAEKVRVKKPRAMRRFERYTSMGDGNDGDT